MCLLLGLATKVAPGRTLPYPGFDPLSSEKGAAKQLARVVVGAWIGWRVVKHDARVVDGRVDSPERVRRSLPGTTVRGSWICGVAGRTQPDRARGEARASSSRIP